MKVIRSRKTIIEILLVVVIGCGSSDNPLREDAQNPSTQAPITEFPPVRSVDQIIGTWLLKSINVFGDDATARYKIDVISLYLTFKPGGTFQAIHRYPIEIFADENIFELAGLPHLNEHKEITVTFNGDYQIVANQLKLTLISAGVEPMEASEIDSDFENPGFLWVGEVGNTGMAAAFLAEKGDKLLLVASDGANSADVIYRRL